MLHPDTPLVLLRYIQKPNLGKYYFFLCDGIVEDQKIKRKKITYERRFRLVLFRIVHFLGRFVR